MDLLIFALALVALVYFGTVAFVRYRTASGTTTQRLWTAMTEAESIVWSHILIISGGLITVIGYLAGALGDPSLQGQITALIKPEYVPAVILGIGVVNYVARQFRRDA